MTSFFKSLFAPFKGSSSEQSETAPRPTSPGPYVTGTEIEAQTSPRQRQFWRRNSTKISLDNVVENGKSQKPAGGEKMGTVSGVFIPTTLNVLSILMYLRVCAI